MVRTASFWLSIGGNAILCCITLLPLVDSQESLETIDRLLEDGEAAHNKWRHPDPYIGKYSTTLTEALFNET